MNTRLIYNFIVSIILTAISNDITAQQAGDDCKFIGNVINVNVPSTFSDYWNQVTPENAGKWGSVESTRDLMNWANLDRVYNYAKTNEIPFRFHTLIWGAQQPGWINTLDPEEQLEEIEEWMRLASNRYMPDWPEDIPFYIDVVNEPINDRPMQYINALYGEDGKGYDWIVKSFELARYYFPNAQLHLNEYNVLNSDTRTAQYIDIINILMEKGLIDGIGLQCHRFEIENTPMSQLGANLDQLAETGLPIFITEFDLGNPGGTLTGNRDVDDAQQLDLYERLFPFFWEHEAVKGITIWGYREGQTWQESTYLLRSDGTERPALTWLRNYLRLNNVCFITSTERAVKPEFVIYPNPSSSGNFMINTNAETTIGRIFDSFGKEIMNFQISGDSYLLDLGNQPSGLYILRLGSETESTNRKLIIAR